MNMYNKHNIYNGTQNGSNIGYIEIQVILKYIPM